MVHDQDPAERAAAVGSQLSTQGLAAQGLTIRDVLDLDPVREGLPQLLTVDADLDTLVRWVHVAESRSAARFLEGGELVLTTGADWPEGQDLAAHIAGVVEAGATAVILELGTRFHRAPDIAVETCRKADLPLVVLHRQVSFVAVTEAAHRLLIGSRVAELEARDRVQALFAELNRLGSSAATVVGAVARQLGRPVVLEDVAHRIVCCAPHDRSEEEVLADWSERSRSTLGSEQGDVIDVAARGRRWGRLVALGRRGALPTSLVDLVLTQASLSLSLGVIESAGDRSNAWDALRHRRLVQMLVEREFTSADHAVAALQAAGLAVEGRSLVAMAWTVHRDGASGRAPQVEDVRGTVSRIAGQLRLGIVCAPEPSVGGGFLAVLTVDRREAERPDVLDDFADRLRASPLALDVIAVGGEVATGNDLEALLPGLARARELIDSTRPGTGGLVRAEGTELDLITGQIASTSLQDFVEKMIGAVLVYDARHGTDLLHVLETYLRYPGNRTRAARESHLSRSVFYQRLDLLESQLGRDLRDGATMAALHLAISAYRRSER